MTNFTLTPTSPLGGFDQTWGDTKLREVSDLSLISLAIPLDGELAFTAFLSSDFGLVAPQPGKTSTSDDKTLIGLAQDQFFLMRPFAENPLPGSLIDAAKGRAHMTDQSDSWVHLEVSGPYVRMALERVCPVNLHPDQFAIGDVARTSMEHLNAIIMRTGHDTFHLMSARSSTHSFLHALVTSIENVC